MRVHTFTYIMLVLIFITIPFQRASSVNKQLQFSHLTVEDGLSQNTVHSIVRDKYGFMWFGTWHGLSRYDGNEFKNYHFDPNDSTSLVNNRVHLLYKDGAGDLWVSTFDTIVCKYNYESDDFTRYDISDLPEGLRDSTDRHNADYYHEVSNDEYIWKIVDNHLIQTEKEGSKAYRYTSSIFSDRSLSNDIVYSIYLDETDVLWVGTAMGGVNFVDLQAQRVSYTPFILNIDGNLIKSPVRAIWADEEHLWLGSISNGLVLTDRSRVDSTNFLLPIKNKAFLSDNVRTIYGDHKGDVWLGYRMGLYRYHKNGKNISRYTSDKIPEYPIYSITEDKNNVLWVGGFNNLYEYNSDFDSFKDHDLPYKHSPSSVMCLTFDQSNNIWAGTELSGLIKVVRDSLTLQWTDTLVYSRSSQTKWQLPDNRVYSLCEDNNGNMWVGTGNGLCKIDYATGTVKVFNKSHGLADTYIAKILNDGDGNLWVSHKRGLSRINLDSEVVSSVSVKGGIRGYEFVDGSGFRDPQNGQLYFGGLDGYVTLMPEKLKGNPYPPEVLLTNLYINNELVEINQDIGEKNILRHPLYMTSTIELSYQNRGFAIEFSAMHYSNSAGNQYVYMLEGYDKEWMLSDEKYKRASYSGLFPGRYTFKVKAANSDGVWSDKPAVLTVVILPPWWRTPWAYLGYFVLLLLITFVVYNIFLVKWKLKHQIEVEKFEVEKIKELQTIRSRFFTSVSHELRTPLTLILDPIERLISGHIEEGDRNKFYLLIQQNSHRLLRLLNQLLAFKRIEVGHEKLNLQKVDINDLLYTIFASFEVKATSKSIVYQYQSDVSHRVGLMDVDKIEKIFYNLLGNAFKYTPNGGEITFEVTIDLKGELASTDNKLLKVKVADTGVGINEKEQTKIFDLFYKSDSRDQENSSGIGLSVIKELILLHGGEINVESSPANGSCFTVKLPFKEAGLKEEQVNIPSLLASTDSSLGEEGKKIEEEKDQNTILVVEDDGDIRKYIVDVLKPYFHVIQASNGHLGFEQAITCQPDLIVTDVVMPEVSGFEFCENLRNDMRTCLIPVIMLTSLSSPTSHIEGVESGADVYLTKPFNSSLLLVHIRNLIISRQRFKDQFQEKDNLPVNSPNLADQKFVDDLKEKVKGNVQSGVFDVQLLSDQMNMSRTQLYRKVKAVTGQSASEVITSIRMKYAAELLLSGLYNVSEVSDRIGYSEPGNFSRAFQKYYGQTPKSYMS